MSAAGQRAGVNTWCACGVSRASTAIRPQPKVAADAPATLNGGSVTIGLSEELGKSQEQLAGAIEIVFRVGSVQAASERLSERGVALVGEAKQVTPNEWAANLRDPDGHLISVFGAR